MALIRATFLLLLSPLLLADERRAEVNYMLHCQGCHLPDAAGFEGRVPPMKNFVGYFLNSDEGRQFVVRVPGVAQSALNDDELAELMNWLLASFSAEQLPDPFVPFTADEVRGLRVDPEPDPVATRARIIDDLAETLPSLAVERERGTR
jgi:hypothetical protein